MCHFLCTLCAPWPSYESYAFTEKVFPTCCRIQAIALHTSGSPVYIVTDLIPLVLLPCCWPHLPDIVGMSRTDVESGSRYQAVGTTLQQMEKHKRCDFKAFSDFKWAAAATITLCERSLGTSQRASFLQTKRICVACCTSPWDRCVGGLSQELYLLGTCCAFGYMW